MCRFLRDPTAEPTQSVPETHFFGVFDGHAGGKCSKAICTTIPYQFSRDEAYTQKVPVALKRAIQRTNEQFLEVAGRMRLNDGSTGVCVVLRGTTMTIANVGDSRACLISARKGITLTEDHKPSSPAEQRRIASFGGTVTYNTGIARVAGVLAVSRAFGNYGIRNLIRADPDITQRELTPDDDFLVLASDGLWDVFRANEVAEVCYTLQKQGVSRIADQLVQLALTRGSMDNITAVVVSLSKYIVRMHASSFEESTSSKRAATISAVLSGVSSAGRYMVNDENVREDIVGRGRASSEDCTDNIDDELTAVDEETFEMEYGVQQQGSHRKGGARSTTSSGQRKPPMHLSDKGDAKGGDQGGGGGGYENIGGLSSRMNRHNVSNEQRSASTGISGLFSRQARSKSQKDIAVTGVTDIGRMGSGGGSGSGRVSLVDTRMQSDGFVSPSNSRRPTTQQHLQASNGSLHSPISSHLTEGSGGLTRRPGSGVGMARPDGPSRMKFSGTGPVLAFGGGSAAVDFSEGSSERMHSPITTGGGLAATLGAPPDRRNRTRPSSSQATKNSMLRSFSQG